MPDFTCSQCGTFLKFGTTVCPCCSAEVPKDDTIPKQKLIALLKEARRYEAVKKNAKKTRFGYVIWFLLAIGWVLLMSKADVHVDENIPKALAGIYTFGILYAIPLIIGFVLSAVGFLLSRRKKQKLLAQLRTYPPKAVAMFEELLVRFPADTSEDRFSDEDWERWKQEEKEKAYEKMMEAWDWD